MKKGDDITFGWRPFQGDVLCNRFLVVSDVASGAHGYTFYVTDESGQPHTAKLIGRELGRERYDNEMKVLKSLQNGHTSEGFPNIHFIGEHHDGSFLCLDLFGYSLSRVSKAEGFNTRTALKFACQMLDRLETLHSHGFVHRDVNPQNCLVDRNGKVHLINFSLSKRYEDPKTRRHLPRQERIGGLFKRTVFGSVKLQGQFAYSRRTDLESLGYSIIEMSTSIVPREEGHAKGGSYFDYLRHLEDSTSLSEICKSLPKAIYQYMVHVRSLSYSDAPDYAALRILLKCKMISM